MQNKILYLNTLLTKSADLPSVSDDIESIYIEGYASTNSEDRMGDVIPASVWERGIENYLKNPVLLAQHNHNRPVGRMTEHKVDGKGLWIKGRVSAAAEDTFNLVKDGLITGLSVGFLIKDAEYNSAAEVFIVKELELTEISLVSVPANQDTLFNLSKSFDNDEDYKSFKHSFVTVDKSAKESENLNTERKTNKEELEMTPEELQALLSKSAQEAADLATKALLKAQEEKEQAEKAAVQAAKAEEEALQAKVKSLVDIEVGKTGAEKLLQEVESRLAKEAETTKSVLEGLQAELKEKSAELVAMQKSKMQFSNAKGVDAEYSDREAAVLLAKIRGTSIESTSFGKALVEKAGPHVASATWEKEVSLNMESEVRRKLVMAPLIRNIPMKTNVMTIPVNPEAGVGTWVTNAQFGTSDSSGTEQTHQLGEITLNAYKVATKEYIQFEEEEDSLIALLPTIRDAMIRRISRAVDRAMIRGAGVGADPVKGVAVYDASSTVAPSAGGAADVADMRALRKDLGAWGLDPSELVFVVSTDVYYDLLDDTVFQSMDKVGAQATLLTGQIGMVGNTPVLVSAEFEAKGAGAIGAFCFAPANFVVGNQRGMRLDRQDMAANQHTIMVSSLRTGLVQLTTNLGAGVSTLRWS